MAVVVRRSALRMWLMALGGIPLLVISLDVLTNRRITNWLREILFRPDETQIFEPRDVIWAWAMLLFAGFIVIWGLKELFFPTRVIECQPSGLHLRLSGPTKPATVVPWGLVEDVDSFHIEDEGQKLPYLMLEFASTSVLPADPWGARWVGPKRLAILAQDWAEDPASVAEQIADYAVEQARAAPRKAVASLWKGKESGPAVADEPEEAEVEEPAPTTVEEGTEEE